MKIDMTDGKLLIDTLGHISVDEEGLSLVEFPPPNGRYVSEGGGRIKLEITSDELELVKACVGYTTISLEVKYTRKRIAEISGQLEAVEKELLGTPIVDIKDRSNPQWSLRLLAARRLRGDRDALQRRVDELQNENEWWVETTLAERKRAVCAEKKLLGVRALLEASAHRNDFGVVEIILDTLNKEGSAPAMPEPLPDDRDRDVSVRSDWMQTASGGVFWPLDPRPQDVSLVDIAHALSNVCRFSGHVREFYSVAQHSVLASRLVPPEDAKWALLHDAAEAYLTDLVRPIKHSPGGIWFRRIEANIMRCVCERFGLPIEQPESVDTADLIMLGTERRDLMKAPPRQWKWVGEPMPEVITPLEPRKAKEAFVNRAMELGIG